MYIQNFLSLLIVIFIIIKRKLFRGEYMKSKFLKSFLKRWKEGNDDERAHRALLLYPGPSKTLRGRNAFLIMDHYAVVMPVEEGRETVIYFSMPTGGEQSSPRGYECSLAFSKNLPL